MLVDFELDHDGIAEILRSAQMRDAMNGTAVAVAAAARGRVDKGDRVVYRPYTTDRQAATVTVLSSRDRSEDLYQAARSTGLDVNEERPTATAE
ncbi:hypothetical protein Q7689_00835 [Nocardiopsis tropica]|uniref:hypothetical protein n=1 Tax=Nocardiopsis tropica TaxID=109330 RepID=UPI002E844FD8|nr:hypothetical protein [Nocardiopsis tropica]